MAKWTVSRSKKPKIYPKLEYYSEFLSKWTISRSRSLDLLQAKWLLDEVQLMVDPENPEDKTAFFKVLNSLKHVINTDIYATGSNSKLLSSIIESIFRGRADIIRIHPLTFNEYYEESNLSKEEALDNYILYWNI